MPAPKPKRKKPLNLPVIPLRGLTLFPYTLSGIEIVRPGSLMAIKRGVDNDSLVLLVPQTDDNIEVPHGKDLLEIGVLGKISQVMSGSDEDGEVPTKRVLLECLERVEVRKPRLDRYGCLVASYSILNYEQQLQKIKEKKVFKATYDLMVQKLREYASVADKLGGDTVDLVVSHNTPDAVMFNICSVLPMGPRMGREILAEDDFLVCMQKVHAFLVRELMTFKLMKNITKSVNESIDKSQRDYFMREQIRALQQELGEGADIENEAEEFSVRLARSKMNDEARAKVEKEIKRFSQMAPHFPETTTIRNWLDLILSLPFGETQDESIDLAKARAALDRDHFGLEKVKERILEQIAVRILQIRQGDYSIRGPILCLVGPPGVGKTSIARAIAEAMGRRYVRMSLGGVHDESEIRGHRRTYIGAMPGRIIQAIQNIKTDNPLFLLDEIDKLGSDFRGDPSAALLEVLDPEQNNTFRDNYLEVDYDLSKVLFVTTANSAEDIPEPLFDRMEIIELGGYTDAEKLEIAKRHLFPRELGRASMTKKQLKVSQTSLQAILSGYTREAGVRQLERELAKICRKAAMSILESETTECINVTPSLVETYLGKRKYFVDMAEKQDHIGLARGLAWTAAGGDTLAIEVTLLPGEGRIEMTGMLGDVMKESARTAMTYIRTQATTLGFNVEETNKTDIHIHVPAGAVPKDGPSAGITLATAFASVFSKRAVDHNIAMTGEITLRGRVLPIGGLKEKAVAASRAGISTIIIPKQNEKDIEDIPLSVRNKLKIITVSQADEVLKLVLK